MKRFLENNLIDGKDCEILVLDGLGETSIEVEQFDLDKVIVSIPTNGDDIITEYAMCILPITGAIELVDAIWETIQKILITELNLILSEIIGWRYR